MLESRRLLTQFTFNVPQNEGFTSVYLRPGLEQGWVDVRKNSATGTVEHTFRGDSNNGTGLYIVDSGGIADFVFVDQVAAELKPTGTPGTPNDHGIKVVGADSRLRLEPTASDTLIEVAENVAADPFIRLNNNTDAETRMGSGVEALEILPYDGTGHQPTTITAFELGAGITLSIDTGDLTFATITLGSGNTITEPVFVNTGAGNCTVNVQNGNGDDGTDATIDFGAGTGTGNGLGLDNVLNVFSVGTARLAPIGGSHTVVVDQVNVSGGNIFEPGTLIVADDATIGTLNVFTSGRTQVEAPATVLEFTVDNGGAASVEADATIGTFTVEGQVDFISTSAGSTVQEFHTNNGAATSAGVVTAFSGADLTILDDSQIGTLKIPGTGKVTFQARPSSGDPTKILTVGTLFMGLTPAGEPLGELDLTNNAMIVDYTGSSSPIGTIQSLITSGYNASATPAFWTGKGVRSTTAAAVALDANALKTGLGYVEATDVFTIFPASWEGQSNVDDTSVLVKYTYYGDVNLDEAVNLVDFNRLAAFFGQSGMRWNNGDSTYDGTVNLQDFNRLAANFGQSGGLSPLGGYTVEDLLQILMEMYPEYF